MSTPSNSCYLAGKLWAVLQRRGASNGRRSHLLAQIIKSTLLVKHSCQRQKLGYILAYERLISSVRNTNTAPLRVCVCVCGISDVKLYKTHKQWVNLLCNSCCLFSLSNGSLWVIAICCSEKDEACLQGNALCGSSQEDKHRLHLSGNKLLFLCIIVDIKKVKRLIQNWAHSEADDSWQMMLALELCVRGSFETHITSIFQIATALRNAKENLDCLSYSEDKKLFKLHGNIICTHWTLC